MPCVPNSSTRKPTLEEIYDFEVNVFETWLVALRRPSRFLPAALILGCTFATRPNSIPTAMPAFVAAISAGALSAGAVRFLFAKAPKKKKKAVASKDD